LALLKIRSEEYYKVAELWNWLLSVHKCFVSYLLFADACAWFTNLLIMVEIKERVMLV